VQEWRGFEEGERGFFFFFFFFLGGGLLPFNGNISAPAKAPPWWLGQKTPIRENLAPVVFPPSPGALEFYSPEVIFIWGPLAPPELVPFS